jgi:hypothetical protein
MHELRYREEFYGVLVSVCERAISGAQVNADYVQAFLRKFDANRGAKPPRANDIFCISHAGQSVILKL